MARRLSSARLDRGIVIPVLASRSLLAPIPQSRQLRQGVIRLAGWYSSGPGYWRASASRGLTAHDTVSLAPWPAHQGGLEVHCRCHRADESQSHQFAHAGGGGIAGEPQAAERACSSERTEDHGSRQGRLHQRGFPAAPSHDIINLERDADPEQQRQCNDIGEVQRDAENDTELEGYQAGDEQRYQGQKNIG